jgi:protein-S-isoprenylcysteine O-methyltransferase Ste14
LRLGLLIILIFLIHADHLKSNFWSDVFGSHVLITRNITLAVIGTVLLILGLLFAVWARVNIGKNWGRPMSEKEDPELVTSGPYKYVRHPIYSGFLLAAFGTGLALGVIWLLIFIVIVIYFMFSAYKEEEFLTKQFGETYKKYKQHTKMLIPFII